MNGLKPIPNSNDYLITVGQRHFHSKLSDVVRRDRGWLWGVFKDWVQDPETDAVVEAAIAEYEKERWGEE